MAEWQEKLEKFYGTICNTKSELRNIYQDSINVLDRQDRWFKAESLVCNLEGDFNQLVQYNHELFYLASITENPDSIYHVLDQCFDDVTKKNIDEFMHAARSYINSISGQYIVFKAVIPQSPSKKSIRLTSSTMTS